MKKNKYLFFCITVIFFFCCTASDQKAADDFFDYTEPTISSISPDDEDTGVLPFQDIIVEFSEDVDKDSAEGAFTLTSSGETQGRFSWNNCKTLVYSPLKGWTAGEEYTVTIERSLEDVNRNHLQRKFTSKFYIGSDFIHPYVTNQTDNPYIQMNPVLITIYFSKEMDINSLHNALTITPSFNYRLELNDGLDGNPINTVLRIYANENLPTREQYTLKISTDAESLTGIPLLRDYYYDFVMYYDIQKPVILNTGWTIITDLTPDIQYVFDPTTDVLIDESAGINPMPKKGAVLVTFSEPMDRATAEAAFNISPSINHKFYWKREVISADTTHDILIFYPETGFEQSTVYSLYVDLTAKDAAGNELDRKGSIYKIKLNKTPPRVSQIVFNPGSPVEIELPDDESSDFLINFSKLDFVVGENYGPDVTMDVLAMSEHYGTMEFYIYFIQADSANYGLSDVTADSDIKNPAANLYPYIAITHEAGINNSDPIIIDKILQGRKVYVKAKNFYCNETDSDIFKRYNTYKLEIKGGKDGVKTDDNTYMENTIIIYFKIKARY